MKERLIQFIKENNLSPFNIYKTQIPNQESIYKTRDAKTIHNRVISKIAQNFVFADTSNLFNAISFTNNIEEIKLRQEFFKKIKSIGKKDNHFLKNLTIPRQSWKPKYDIVVVTENSDTFNKLREINCPVQLLISENDLRLLENRDLVQVIDCDEYGLVLESLPQAVFLNSIEEVYLERYLEQLSTWKENIEILKQNMVSQSLQQLVQNLSPLLLLIREKNSEVLTLDKVETDVEKINFKIMERIKEMSISGESLISMLSKGVLPEQLKQIVREEINQSNLPNQILIEEIPVKIFQEELEKTINHQNAFEYSNLAQEIKNYSKDLKQIPKKIQELNESLLIFDFITGISQFLEEEMDFPEFSEEIIIQNSKNLFLENPQPISFELNQNYKSSILTGANSGGKTTLLEHVIQLISLFQIGLPIKGKTKLPIFTEVYYFAKNKGAANKGAFENLLTQMSQIKPGNQTLILADEIEAVTEPGVAGNIISATVDYYIKKNCFLIIATHLGYEIQKRIPPLTRIDGIEAKGLTEDFELIVDHNPVLGRLAHSTPELIVEKMANTKQNDYFKYLNDSLKK
jgi:hypothetical protein